MIMFKILDKYNILKITDSVEKHGLGPFNRTYFASTHTDNDYIIQLYEKKILIEIRISLITLKEF